MIIISNLLAVVATNRNLGKTEFMYLADMIIKSDGQRFDQDPEEAALSITVSGWKIS